MVLPILTKPLFLGFRQFRQWHPPVFFKCWTDFCGSPEKSVGFSISQSVTRQVFLRVVVSIKSDLLVQAATRNAPDHAHVLKFVEWRFVIANRWENHQATTLLKSLRFLNLHKLSRQFDFLLDRARVTGAG